MFLIALERCWKGGGTTFWLRNSFSKGLFLSRSGRLVTSPMFISFFYNWKTFTWRPAWSMVVILASLRCIEFQPNEGFRANHSLSRVGQLNSRSTLVGFNSGCISQGCVLIVHNWKVFPISFSSEPSVDVPARDNPSLPSIGGDVCRYAWKLLRSAWLAVTDIFCCPLLTSFSSYKSNRTSWIKCSKEQIWEHFWQISEN